MGILSSKPIRKVESLRKLTWFEAELILRTECANFRDLFLDRNTKNKYNVSYSIIDDKEKTKEIELAIKIKPS